MKGKSDEIDGWEVFGLGITVDSSRDGKRRIGTLLTYSSKEGVALGCSLT